MNINNNFTVNFRNNPNFEARSAQLPKQEIIECLDSGMNLMQVAQKYRKSYYGISNFLKDNQMIPPSIRKMLNNAEKIEYFNIDLIKEYCFNPKQSIRTLLNKLTTELVCDRKNNGDANKKIARDLKIDVKKVREITRKGCTNFEFIDFDKKNAMKLGTDSFYDNIVKLIDERIAIKELDNNIEDLEKLLKYRKSFIMLKMYKNGFSIEELSKKFNIPFDIVKKNIEHLQKLTVRYL